MARRPALARSPLGRSSLARSLVGRARPGYTLIETVFAAIIASILLAAWMGMIGDSSVKTVALRDRSIAMNIALSEVERLRVVGARNAASAIGSRRVGADGANDVNGDYLIRVSESVVCYGGAHLGDNQSVQPIRASCTGVQRPVVYFTVRVTFDDPNREGGESHIEYTLPMTDGTPHGGALPAS
jgi:type II secretory pathway pseudopilin PulG